MPPYLVARRPKDNKTLSLVLLVQLLQSLVLRGKSTLHPRTRSPCKEGLDNGPGPVLKCCYPTPFSTYASYPLRQKEGLPYPSNKKKGEKRKIG
jgi:hypothetical protein